MNKYKKRKIIFENNLRLTKMGVFPSQEKELIA